MLIADCIPTTSLHAFTIGTFDGVHLGHQALLAKLKSTGKPTAVLTFSAHPLKALNPKLAPPLITPLPIKLLLLKEQGMGLTIAIPFTAKFALTPFEELLDTLPLSHLVLGKGATFGHNREGSEKNVRSWGNLHEVPIEYIEKTLPVSSQKIREAICTGDLALAEQLLGRPHLLYVPANTVRLSIAGLAMPPDGNYLLSLLSSPAESSSLKQYSFPRTAGGSPAGPKFVGSIKAEWIHLSTSFPEPTILSFNLPAAAKGSDGDAKNRPLRSCQMQPKRLP